MIARGVNRVRIAQAFPGWTLEYIDTLDEFDLLYIYGVLDADAKLQERANNLAKQKPRGR